MANEAEIAVWMVRQFKNNMLYQEQIAWALKRKFGDSAIYTNDNGNFAINKLVLKEFRKLTDGKIVWVRGDKAWKVLKNNEKYTGRQQD